MYSKDFIIENYILTHSKTFAFPKADGRVEVPQQIVNQAGWKKEKYIHVGFVPGELYLSKTNNFESYVTYLGKMVINDGRIRIYAGYLKKCGFAGKSLSMVIANGHIIVRLDNTNPQSGVEIKEFVRGLSDEQKDKLSGIILQTFRQQEQPPKVKSGDKLNLPKQKEPRKDGTKVYNPELLLLDVGKPVVFTPVNMPVRFPGFWSTKHKEVVLLHKSVEKVPVAPTPLYVIPGIEKLSGGSFRVGYLLLDSKVYADLVHNIKIGRIKDNRDIIFWYDSPSFCKFKFFNNPPASLNPELVGQAKTMCSNPAVFLIDTFRTVYACDDLDEMPTLTKQVVRPYNGE